jgi:hypothetical protein
MEWFNVPNHGYSVPVIMTAGSIEAALVLCRYLPLRNEYICFNRYDAAFHSKSQQHL